MKFPMSRTFIAAAALATASFAFVPASQAEDLGGQPVAAPNTEAQPEAYRSYDWSGGYGYARASYSYGYARPSYGYARPSYGYARPSHGYGYRYGYRYY